MLQWHLSLSVCVLLVWLPSTLYCSVTRNGMASEIKLGKGSQFLSKYLRYPVESELESHWLSGEVCILTFPANSHVSELGS